MSIHFVVSRSRLTYIFLYVHLICSSMLKPNSRDTSSPGTGGLPLSTRKLSAKNAATRALNPTGTGRSTWTQCGSLRDLPSSIHTLVSAAMVLTFPETSPTPSQSPAARAAGASKTAPLRIRSSEWVHSMISQETRVVSGAISRRTSRTGIWA